VSHGRLFLDVPAKGVSIDITVETRDRQHTSEVFEALAAEGLAPQRIASRSLPQTAF
jgi:threonine dehydratase